MLGGRGGASGRPEVRVQTAQVEGPRVATRGGHRGPSPWKARVTSVRPWTTVARPAVGTSSRSPADPRPRPGQLHGLPAGADEGVSIEHQGRPAKVGSASTWRG